MADGDEPWLNDPIVKPADNAQPQWSSTPAPGLEGMVPQIKGMADGQPDAPVADDQPWLKDPIVQPAQQPEAPEKPWAPTAAQTIPNPLRRGSDMPQDNSRDLETAGSPTSRINFLLTQGYKAIDPEGQEIAKLDETPSTQGEGYRGSMDDQVNISPEEEFNNWKDEGIKFLHPDGSQVKNFKEMQYDPDWKNKLKYMNEYSPRAPYQPPSAPQSSQPQVFNDSAAIAGGASAAQMPQASPYDTQNVRGMSEADFMAKTPQGPAPSMTPEKMAAQLEGMPGGSNSAMRALYAGLAQTAGSGMSLAGRIISSVDPSAGKAVDQLNRDLGTAEQGAALADKEKDASLPEWALSGGRRVVQGVSTAMIAGPAAVPVFGADAANKAATDADDHGLTGKDKALYVGGEAAINMATGALLQKLGLNKLGGGTVTAGGLKEAIKGFGVTAATTTTQNLLAAMNRKIAGLDNGKPIDFGELVRNSIVDAVLFTGAHELNSRVGDALKAGPSPDHVQLAVENPDAAWKIASKDQPSRKDIQDAGITQRMNADQRAAFAEKLRNYFTQDQAQQVPGNPKAPAGMPPRQNDSPIAGEKFNLDTAKGMQGQPEIEGQSQFSAKELQDRLGDRVPSQPQENNQNARRTALDEGMAREDPRLAQVRDLEGDNGERPTKNQVAEKLGVSREDARDLIKQTYANEPLPEVADMTREQLADEAGVDKPGAMSRSTLEQKVEDKRDTERRVDVLNRTRVDEMSPEDRKYALLHHELTGIANARAYREAPKKAVQAQIDIEGLKFFNDEVGKKLGVGDEAGDEVLKAAANIMAAAKGEFYNTHGDTFLTQADTHEELIRIMNEAEHHLANTTVDVQLPDGTVKTYKGIGIAWGKGKSLGEAHADMEADKVRRVENGKRAPRGQRPRSLAEVTPEGIEDSSSASPDDRLRQPAVNPGGQPDRSGPPEHSGQQAAGDNEPPGAGARQAIQPDVAQSVQPGQGNPAEGEHSATSAPEGQPAAAPAKGVTRLYHGEAPEAVSDRSSPRWFTTDQKYAEGYARKSNGVVSYIDLPKDSPAWEHMADMGGNRGADVFDKEGKLKTTTVSGNLPPEFAGKRQPLNESPPSESLTREDLAQLSHAEIRKRLADEFGLKSTGSKAKDIERYMQATGEQHLGAAFGGTDVSGLSGRGVVDAMKGMGRGIYDAVIGKSLPNSERDAGRNVSEKLAEHAAASIAAPEISKSLYAKVFGKDAKLANRVAAVLTEDNLRGVADQKTAAKEDASSVHSLIGEGKPFATEADYQKEAQAPEIQAAIERWKKYVNPWMDAQYRSTRGMESDTELPTRGRDFGARINLLASAHADGVAGVKTTGANPDNPRRNYNPLGKTATGEAGSGYSTDAQSILDNSINTVYGKATRLRAIDALVKSGKAQFGEKGVAPPEGKASLTVEVPGKDGLEKKTLYFPKSMEEEVRQVLNTDLKQSPNMIAKTINAMQMFGVTDAKAHIANIFSGVNNALSGSTLKDLTLRGVYGLRQMDTLRRIAEKAIDVHSEKPETQEAIANLARIGALRPEHESKGVGALVGAADKAGRLVLNDFFDGLVKAGKVEDTDTNRREFVNQIGQYNSRMKSKAFQFFKDYGLAPFMTAGTTFARQGAKSLVGSPGVEASSTGAAAEMRATQIVRNIVSTLAIGAAGTFLLTGKPSRAGVPLGAIDTGKDDDKGKPVYIDLMGLPRRGLNVTGLGKIIDGLQRGQDGGLMADAAARDIVNHNLHAFAGPAVGAASEALLGKRLGWGLPPMPAADRNKGETQVGKNFKTAAKDLNPLLGGAANFTLPGPDQGKAGALKDAGTEQLKALAGVKSATAPGSPMTEYARSLYYNRIGEKQYTDEQQQAHDVRAQVARDVKNGMSKEAAIQKAVDTGLVTEKEALSSAKSGAKGSESSLYGKMTAEELKHVMDRGLDATAGEKAEIKAQFDKHVGNLMKPLAAKIPAETAKKEQWKANLDSAIQRAQKLGLSKDEVRDAYLQTLKAVKSDEARAADRQRFMIQLNYRWNSTGSGIATKGLYNDAGQNGPANEDAPERPKFTGEISTPQSRMIDIASKVATGVSSKTTAKELWDNYDPDAVADAYKKHLQDNVRSLPQRAQMWQRFVDNFNKSVVMNQPDQEGGDGAYLLQRSDLNKR